MPDETIAQPFPNPPDQNATVARPPGDTAAPKTTIAAPNAPTGSTAPTGARGVPGFEVLGELGRGGAAVVYRARQTGLGREVALKMVLHGAHATADELDRFRTEAAAIAKLRHPHIVEVFAFGETADGLPYFAMEFCDGGTLARHCTGELPVRAAVELAATVAAAVRFAHAAGIVHRDLKPANVLLTAAGAPKVSDFGLAKSLTESDSRTRTGAIMGTPAYMAPEQAEGRGHEVGPAADVYALGAILFALLSGRPPFDGGSVVDTLRAVVRDEPPRPRALRRDIPPDLEAVVLQCLEKRPEARYATAGELADDLERWLRGEPVRARRGALYRARKWLSRNRARVWAGCAALSALAVGWVLLADAGFGVPGGAAVRRRIDRHELSPFRPAPTAAELKAEAAAHRAELLNYVFRVAPRKDHWMSNRTQAGEVFANPDAWTAAHSVACLLKTPDSDPAELRRLVRVLHTDLFETNAMFRGYAPGVGWEHYVDQQPGTEPAGWALTGIAVALARPELLAPGDRERLLARLDQLQQLFDACYLGNGRWSALPNGRPDNIFAATMAYQALIELSHGGLPWRGSTERRAALFRETHAALLAQFDGKGWPTIGRTLSETNDGLTLQLFALTLRAEALGLAAVPEGVLAPLPAHLEACRARRLAHPIVTALFPTIGTGFQGQKLDCSRPVKFLWYPWAVESAARLHARQLRAGAPRDERVNTRRALGHLVLALGSEVRTEVPNGYTYVQMETLLGLSAVEEME